MGPSGISARRSFALAVTLLGLGLHAREAAAQLAPEGAPIDNSDYTIDFYTGPLLESSRNTGLAGSFSALSAGVGSYATNPASVALRVPWSDGWFDWELDGSITLPATLRNADFDNNGDNTVGNDAALYLTGGLGLQFGELGLGVSFGVNSYETTSIDGDGIRQALDVSFVTVNVVLGCLLEEGQLALGLGLGGQSVDLARILPDDSQRDLASVTGSTLQLGSIWAPKHLSIRAGVALRISINDESDTPDGIEPDENDDYRVDNFVLPRRINVPTELQVSFATQLFRPLNFGWHNPRRQPLAQAEPNAHRALPRRRVLLSSALKLTFPTREGVGTDAFLLQRVERSGEKLSISPRVGVETEPIIDWLIVRAGSYYEPTRFPNSSARVHATAGADLHIPIVWSVFGLFDDDTSFRIGGAVDGADRYFGWSISAGVWR